MVYFLWKTCLLTISLLLCLKNIATNRSENPCIDNFTGRIIGGQTASPDQFPFMASLRNESNGLWGGATILNEKWLITAAHCVQGYTTKNLSVVVGSNLISSGGVPHNLSSIIINPNYNTLTVENDIALIKVEEDIIFDDLIQPIEFGEGSGNETGTVLGWGLARWGYYPEELQFLTTRVTSNEECRSYWDSLADTQICALLREGAGVCCGDSGGPLVAGGKLIGLVSYGAPCALGSPDIYTRVAAFTQWIEKNIN